MTWNQAPSSSSDDDGENGSLKRIGPLLREFEQRDCQQATDFYEFYWAPRFRDTKPSDLLRWGGRLLIRKRAELFTTRLAGRRADGRLRSRFASSLAWSLLAAWAIALALLACVDDPSDTLGWVGNIGAWLAIALIAVAVVVGLVAASRVQTPGRLGFVIASGAAGAGAILLTLVAKKPWSGHPATDDTAWWVLQGIAATLVLALLILAANRSGPISTMRWALAAMPLSVAIWSAVASDGRVRVPTAVVSVLGGLAALLGGTAALRFGDVPRYLVRSPGNIDEVERLRSDAVEALRRLHAMRSAGGKPRYERIVVVGHSLGSVIAYDALTAYWAKVNTRLRFPDARAQDPIEHRLEAERLDALRELERTGTKLALAAYFTDPKGRAAVSTSARVPNATARELARYRAAQARLVDLISFDSRPGQAETGTDVDLVESDELEDEPLALGTFETQFETSTNYPARWAISDFITVGSPLAHAELLLARSLQQLVDSQTERTLPTCPPQPARSAIEADLEFQNEKVVRYRVGSTRGRYLHQAALFGPCRWTNLFFGRDGVGGPLSPVFGPGILDIEVGRPGIGTAFQLASSGVHGAYWAVPRFPKERSGYEDAVALLRSIIRRAPRLQVHTTDPDAAGAIAAVVRSLPQPDLRASPGHDLIEIDVSMPAPPSGGRYRRIILRHSTAATPETVATLATAVEGVGARVAWSPDIRPVAFRNPAPGQGHTATRP